MQAVPDFDDKLLECEFFFELLSKETDRSKFRWLLSGFFNATYSFFESSALTAHFRYTDSDGEQYEDEEGLSILQRHIKADQSKKNPTFVKTAGLTPLTTQLYEIRKKSTHGENGVRPPIYYNGLAKNTAQLHVLFAMANLVLSQRSLCAPYRTGAS